MASDFVRNIKGVRNIDILSPNITTENDLISTSDGVVYVVTKKGYQRITPGDTEQDIEVLENDVKNLKTQSDSNTLNISGNTDDIETNTSEIATLKTSTDNNTSEIETLKTTTGNNTSEIETLKTTTDTNTSDIADLKTTTDTNTSDIADLKTTTATNTSDIETLNNTTATNTSDIDTLKTSTSTNTTSIDDLLNEINTLKSNMLQHQVIYTGSANGTGSVLPLEHDIYDYKFIILSGTYPGGTFNETVLISSLTGDINIQKDNLRDSTGVFLGVYEIKITANTGTELEITNDVSWDEAGGSGSGQDRNAYTITNIEGVK